MRKSTDQPVSRQYVLSKCMYLRIWERIFIFYRNAPKSLIRSCSKTNHTRGSFVTHSSFGARAKKHAHPRTILKTFEQQMILAEVQEVEYLISFQQKLSEQLLTYQSPLNMLIFQHQYVLIINVISINHSGACLPVIVRAV